MPERIQRQRVKGWRLPPNTRCVTRPGYFGNRYRVGDYYVVGLPLRCPMPAAQTVPGPIGNGDLECVRCPDAATDKLARLRGLNLACWCPLDQPCHADVLLEIANAHTKETPA